MEQVSRSYLLLFCLLMLICMTFSAVLMREPRLSPSRKLFVRIKSEEDENDTNFLNYSANGAPPQQMCTEKDSNNWYIYCSGRIIEAVGYHNIFTDSKTYVDMPLKMEPEKVLAAFDEKFGNKTASEIDAQELVDFIGDNFSEAGDELVKCTPPDLRNDVKLLLCAVIFKLYRNFIQSIPASLMSIEDSHFREWAIDLYKIWGELCRKVDDRIRDKIDQYSLLYIENQFIIPGGRFREFYYWDAYWIVKGLMASEMYDSAKLMIRNLATIVKRYGFVPNGGRVYYLRRSHPPLLTAMVYEYYESRAKHVRDTDFLHEMLPVLELELEFWDSRRRVTVQIEGTNNTFQPYMYAAESNVPRPESFKEDLATAENLTATEKLRYYQSAASAAESGWDFSSRWLLDGGSDLSTMETIDIVPVDLNSFMCWNFDLLHTLYYATHNYSRSVHFRKRYNDMQDIMDQIFYNDTSGAWFDYNLRTQAHNAKFYPSVAMPLFANCYSSTDQEKPERLFYYMKKAGVFGYPGGVPTSLSETGQQWDFPNGWSPLNHIIIEGLRKSESPLMQEEGYRIAKKWVYSNYGVYRNTKHMWEKYNVIGESAAKGHGGEYEIQDGFGWTNGVILDLLVTYYDRFQWVEPNPVNSSTMTPPYNTATSVNSNTTMISSTANSLRFLPPYNLIMCTLFFLFL